MYNVICYCVNIISTILIVPKVCKVYKEQSGQSISILYVLFRMTISILLLIYAYGLFKYIGFDIAMPVIISQSSILICSNILLILKYKYRNNRYTEIIDCDTTYLQSSS